MIDWRSDTVTLPSQAMRKVMCDAAVGDDVYGEDPTVNRLEDLAAELFGKEAALFAASGTQSNLIALMSHCGRGDEYIVGHNAHTYKYEGGGAAVLGSIQPQPVQFERDGTLDLAKVENVIKPDDSHFARTKLLALENTTSGKALPMIYLQQAADFAKQHQLALHLDGARVFNAAVQHQVNVAEIAQYFDSVSCCLSKGLGAPIGAVLVGDKSFIDEARRWRKVVGGGMRQAGIIAAAGIYALENNIQRLLEDHEVASSIHAALAQMDEFELFEQQATTNMVWGKLVKGDAAQLSTYAKDKGILISPGNPFRFVAHLDVSMDDVTTTIEMIKKFFSSNYS